ncbi:MAG: HAD-IA family hydrolase [Desulfobacterales bacterium]|nr:HAD-IA family hydrolase [Desulfobacterales bacterium]
MNGIKAVVFDCDGVMFNTDDANKAYYNSILSHFKKPDMTLDEFNFAQMHTADESIAHLFKERESFKKAQEYRKKMSYFPFIKDMEMEPYLIPLLKKLRPEFKTAIATNRSDTMNSVLQEHGLEEYFDIVVSALDVKMPKPHPEPLLKVLKYFNIGSTQAIYIGDSELDELSAKKAGIPLVAYNNQSLTADFHITSLKQIENIIM